MEFAVPCYCKSMQAHWAQHSSLADAVPRAASASNWVTSLVPYKLATLLRPVGFFGSKPDPAECKDRLRLRPQGVTAWHQTLSIGLLPLVGLFSGALQ